MRIVRVLLCAFAVSLACASGGADDASGAEPPLYRLMIASQPLAAALQEFARQSGVQVIFFSRLTDGLRAPALDGQYTLRSALSALLANSPLTFRMINSRTVQIMAVTPHDREPLGRRRSPGPGAGEPAQLCFSGSY